MPLRHSKVVHMLFPLREGESNSVVRARAVDNAAMCIVNVVYPGALDIGPEQ